MEMDQFLARQLAFSRATFGPGRRTNGVLDHIAKEVIEVRESGGSPKEWVDLVLLSLDGLLRAHAFPEGHSLCSIHAARRALDDIEGKLNANEIRIWPDWRTQSEDRAIEHDRSRDA